MSVLIRYLIAPVPLGVVLIACLSAPGAALSSSAGEIRAFLEGLDAGADPFIAGRRLLSGEAVSEFYGARQHDPVWTRGRRGRVRLESLLNQIRASADHGLVPERYHLAALGEDGTAALAVELLATDAFLTQARHRVNGVVSQDAPDGSRDLPLEQVHEVQMLVRALQQNGIADSLAGLWPHHEAYQALVARRRALAPLVGSEEVRVPEGGALKYGQSSPRVVALKKRLLGPGGYQPEFDDALRGAVLDFQASVGLLADGIVGGQTLALLNAPRTFWLNTLDANLERWRWLPNELPERYLSVNTAAFELSAIDDAIEAIRMRVIVGRPYRSTPMFTDRLQYLVVNPTWNIPFEIAVKDKLPHLKREPIRLALQGYEARAAGTDYFVPVDTIDWRGVSRDTFRYDLRQLPGPTNALGRIKFMLPNRFAVYLHDTPDRGLFDRLERDFSSGCIRLADPLGLADWVLRHDGQADVATRMGELLAGDRTHTVYLKEPIPVMIVYFTAFAGNTGEIEFRRDLYQRDQAIINALKGY